ncbi:hypothetical protein [Mycolicibacterium arenosum]|uniref:DUF2530 domain-containing protein n=1 Tax=Mycolicibacterium arenosum TaxID=2952157 RepID=A0ABT1MCN7_9MYCO|nr:hypothetical protein [Mycolicibacterium sp. CAU 1645]MCP9276939.1 hypothetical protein [Mycolicibacterium sp. CAU 1645]
MNRVSDRTVRGWMPWAAFCVLWVAVLCLGFATDNGWLGIAASAGLALITGYRAYRIHRSDRAGS